MKKTIVFSLFLLGIFCTLSLAQSDMKVPVITLGQVIEKLDQHPALAAREEQIQSYQAYSQSAKALEAPKITAGFWMYPYPVNKEQMQQQGGSFMIAAEQMIMHPAKRKSEQQYMAGMSAVDQTMKAAERQELIQEAKNLYFERQALEKKKIILRESKALLQLMIQSAEIGYTYNQNELNRIYKARTELYDLEKMELMNESEILSNTTELNTLLQAPPEQEFMVDTNFRIQAYESLLLDTNKLINNKSELVTIEKNLGVYNLKRELELSKRKPDFGIQYAHMQGFNGMANQFNLMGMITVPIVPWAARSYKANLAGIKHDQASLRLKKQAMLLQIASEVRKTQNELKTAKKEFELYNKNILPSLEKNFRTSLIAYEHMKEDLFMTIDGLKSLTMARLQNTEVLSRILKLQAAYERLVEEP